MHELLDDAGPRPLLVHVDDAHLLDDGSASLVHQLVLAEGSGHRARLRPVIVSRRPARRRSHGRAVEGLWRGADQLGPLDDQAIEDLLLAVLGGPVDTVSLRQLAERSLGDPLFLHELVGGALENGTLRERAASGACAARCVRPLA